MRGIPRNNETSMNGTFDVCKIQQFLWVYVNVAHRWTRPIQKLIGEYCFGGPEPDSFATNVSTCWYRGATRALNGSNIHILEPGEFAVSKHAYPIRHT